MDATELHNECITACMECPQFQGFDDDSRELLRGRSVEVNALPSKGLAALLWYWSMTDSIGGELLWESGYASALSDEARDMLDQYRDPLSGDV